MKKIFFMALACIMFLSGIQTASAAKEPTYLGMPQSSWEEALKGLPITNHAAFYEGMKESANELRDTNDAEHYEKLGTDGSLRKKHKDNPLLQMKPGKTGKRYMTDLKLDKSDFLGVVTLIKPLSAGYGEKEIASLMPYIAYCINKGIGMQDIRFYCRWFASSGTPVEIAKQRLLRLVDNAEGYDRDIFKR